MPLSKDFGRHDYYEYRRRRKVLSIGMEDLLSIIRGTASIWELDDIPSDAVIGGVEYQMCSDSFDILLLHPSFDVVPAGAMAQRLRTDLKVLYKAFPPKVNPWGDLEEVE